LAENHKIELPVAQNLNPSTEENKFVSSENIESPQSAISKLDSENEIGTIEFRPSSTKAQDEELATVEWKRKSLNKETIMDQISKVKSGQISNIPTVGEAKENLFAILTSIK
jgi:hypothetical protein